MRWSEELGEPVDDGACRSGGRGTEAGPRPQAHRAGPRRRPRPAGGRGSGGEWRRSRPGSAEHRPTRVVTCGNYDGWLQLVATGRGVGAVPRSAARTDTHPGVTFIPLAGAPPVSVCLTYRPRRGDPLVRRFVDVAATAASAEPLQELRTGMPGPPPTTSQRDSSSPRGQGCRRGAP
ncbi:LysR substrate-binding domain-containing protein [Geodermatophilus chilensis]|jgi:DNA-binding transcriptional LysR family regulator|uniref:LysR substrate-binding domain-containing protein n=1 Tax=Geodermatophilus chilensis TaxID=2035835 RepID=UPI0038CC08B4